MQIKFNIPPHKYKVGDRFKDLELLPLYEEDLEDELITQEDFEKTGGVREIMAHSFVAKTGLTIFDILEANATETGYDCLDLGCHVYLFRDISNPDYNEDFLTEIQVADLIDKNILLPLPPNSFAPKYPETKLGQVHQKWMDFEISDDESSTYHGKVEENYRIISGFETGEGSIPSDGDRHLTIKVMTLTPVTLDLFASGWFFSGIDLNLETHLRYGAEGKNNKEYLSGIFDGKISYEDGTAELNGTIGDRHWLKINENTQLTRVDLKDFRYCDICKNTEVSIAIPDHLERNDREFYYPGIVVT
jgi:hypothetical protein